MKINTIAAFELDNYVGNNNAIIVDVRSSNDYRKRHITGAINVPFEEIERKNFNRDKELIIYCARGASSIMAASRLAQKGYKVKSVVGGLNAYHGSFLS